MTGNSWLRKIMNMGHFDIMLGFEKTAGLFVLEIDEMYEFAFFCAQRFSVL